MKAIFIELPAFDRLRPNYLNDERFRMLQDMLMENRSQFWLFTLYDKDEANDLNPRQRAALRELIRNELKMRNES